MAPKKSKVEANHWKYFKSWHLDILVIRSKHFEAKHVIKFLEKRSLACIIQVSPKCNHVYPYKRGAEGDLTCREGNVNVKAEIGVMWPQIEECHGMPVDWEARNKFFPRASRGSMSLLILWFQTSGLQTDNTFLYKATQFVVICHSSHRKLMYHSEVPRISTHCSST